MQDNGNAVKILEKLGVEPSKMPEEIIKDPLAPLKLIPPCHVLLLSWPSGHIDVI